MSDAVWVALTLQMSNVLDTSDQDSLAAFIGCADMINHAIITRDELARGLDALMKRGWIVGKGSSVQLSDRGRAALDAAIAETRSSTSFSAVQKRFDADPTDHAPPAPPVDADAFERARSQHAILMDSIVIRMKTRI